MKDWKKYLTPKEATAVRTMELERDRLIESRRRLTFRLFAIRNRAKARQNYNAKKKGMSR